MMNDKSLNVRTTLATIAMAMFTLAVVVLSQPTASAEVNLSKPCEIAHSAHAEMASGNLKAEFSKLVDSVDF